MTGRYAWVALVLATAGLGCVLAQPRRSARGQVTSASVGAPSPQPSCSGASVSGGTAPPNDNAQGNDVAAAAWPATPVVPLTPTPFPDPTPNDGDDPSAAPAATTTPSPADVTPAIGAPAPGVTPVIAAPPGTPVTVSGTPPAMRYAALDDASCLAELKKRAVPFKMAESTTGVTTPVRFTGKVRGVDVHGFEPPAKRPTSVWEIVDCRLALAIDDFAQILAKHDVVEAVHMSMYRPPPKWFKGKPARHDAALAIDLGSMVKKDGTKLRVLEDWHGGIGTKTCGPGAGPSKATPEATEIRKILCEAAEAQIFNVILTPNYNKPHANHFHLEVTRGVKWFLVH